MQNYVPSKKIYNSACTLQNPSETRVLAPTNTQAYVPRQAPTSRGKAYPATDIALKSAFRQIVSSAHGSALRLPFWEQ